MFSKKLKPIFTSKKNLIRLGPKRDGGYVVDKRIIKKIDYIVTCGLSDDWNFEKDFLKYNNNVSISAYDHTVNSSFWIKKFFKDIIDFFLLKKLRIWKILNIFKFLDYWFFFQGNRKHFKLKIGKKNIPNKEISIKKILENKNNILLKVDIEDAEYKILKEIIREYKKINCLIIEFHSIKKNLKTIKNFVNKIKNLKIIHIHGNNVKKLDKYGYPYALEITFINSRLIKNIKKNNMQNYPIVNLDFPSVKRNKDIKLIFN